MVLLNNHDHFPRRNFRHDENFSWSRIFCHGFSSWQKFSSWIFVVTKNLAGVLSWQKFFCHHENWWQNFFVVAKIVPMSGRSHELSNSLYHLWYLTHGFLPTQSSNKKNKIILLLQRLYTLFGGAISINFQIFPKDSQNFLQSALDFSSNVFSVKSNDRFSFELYCVQDALVIKKIQEITISGRYEKQSLIECQFLCDKQLS